MLQAVPQRVGKQSFNAGYQKHILNTFNLQLL